MPIIQPYRAQAPQGGLLEELRRQLASNRQISAQDEQQNRDGITRGQINQELGIDPNASWEQYQKAQQGTARTGLLEAQSNNSQASADRTLGLMNTDTQNLLEQQNKFNQMQQKDAGLNSIQGFLSDRVTQGISSTGNAELDALARSGLDPAALSRVVGGSQMGTSLQGASAAGKSQSDRDAFTAMTPNLAARGDALAPVQAAAAKLSAEAVAPVSRENTRIASEQSLANAKVLQEGARVQNQKGKDQDQVRGLARQKNETSAYASGLGVPLTPEEVQFGGRDLVDAKVLVNNGQMEEALASIRSIRERLQDENGQISEERRPFHDKMLQLESEAIQQQIQATMNPAAAALSKKKMDIMNLDIETQQAALKEANKPWWEGVDWGYAKELLPIVNPASGFSQLFK